MLSLKQKSKHIIWTELFVEVKSKWKCFFKIKIQQNSKKKMLANSSSTVPLHSSSSWTSNAANWTVQIVSELEETSGGQQLLFLNLV